MTPLQHRALRFIRGYQKATDGISPTLAEIAVGLGYGEGRAPSAHRVVVQLERAGWIIRPRGGRRDITIVEVNPLARFSSAELHAELERRDNCPIWQGAVHHADLPIVSGKAI